MGLLVAWRTLVRRGFVTLTLRGAREGYHVASPPYCDACPLKRPPSVDGLSRSAGTSGVTGLYQVGRCDTSAVSIRLVFRYFHYTYCIYVVLRIAKRRETCRTRNGTERSDLHIYNIYATCTASSRSGIFLTSHCCGTWMR